MPNLGVTNIRSYLFLAFICNLLTIIGLVISNVWEPKYFNVETPASIGDLPFDIIIINIFIRFVLPCCYFVITIWVITFFLMTIYEPKCMKISSYSAEMLSYVFVVLQLAALAVHVTVISLGIDMYRTNPDCLSTTNQLTHHLPSLGTPWTDCSVPGHPGEFLAGFPWHLVVLCMCVPAFLALVFLIAVVRRFRWFHKKVKIFTLLDNTPKVTGHDNPPFPDKTRVIKIEASGPADDDGNIRVLLKEREDGEFEVISQSHFDELDIEVPTADYDGNTYHYHNNE